jgi:hypothetical protein
MGDEEKAKLQPANENPWYSIATVYGEPERIEKWWKYEYELMQKNRTAWNRWTANALTDEQRAELIAKGFAANELTPFSEAEYEEFLKQCFMRARKSNVTIPKANEMIDFNDIVFDRPVYFGGFVFAAHVRFINTEFRDGVGFDNTKFMETVSFGKANFRSTANFGGAVFSGRADFKEAAYFDLAYFKDTKFHDDVIFERVKFKFHTVFSGTEFNSGVPDFRDAELPEATEWHDARWPLPPKSKKAAEQQVSAYERLKAEMERLKKHEDEQKFFAMELRARRALLWFECCDGKRAIRKRAKSAFGWTLNRGYALFSGYGLSIGRPFFGLIALFVVGVGVSTTTASLVCGPMNLRQAAEFSFTNLFPFLPNKAGDDIIKHLAIWAKYFGDLQSLLGVILLFLLGLALRNRFRMK